MKDLFYIPHPALGGLVNNIMISRIKTDPALGKPSFPFPPLPEHCIFFYPLDKPTLEDPVTRQVLKAYGCSVAGPQTERVILSFGYNHLVIKIGFQPGGLYRLLGIPMSGLLQYKLYDGAILFGKEVNDTVDALANATCVRDMQTITESFLFAQTAKIKSLIPMDHVLPDILKYDGSIRIDKLVWDSCLSNRQFERVFKDRMGLSPKHYSRLVRFGKAWLMKEDNPATTWTKIAYQCGYFDQMHMIRDFQEFARTTPNAIASAFKKQPFSLHNRIFY